MFGASQAHALPPAAKLAALILRDSAAKADVKDLIDRNFLSIHLGGAPNRWVWDQFLKTKPTDIVNPNPLCATRYVATNGVYTAAEYATINYKGVEVPPIWGTKVRSANGQRNMTDLLEHMIVFRGYGSGVDGHPGNTVKQYMPLPSAGSITGTMADHSDNLMKAVQFPAGVANETAFSSIKGMGSSAIGYGGPNVNALMTLMHPFTKRGDAQSLEALRSRYKGMVETVQGVLNQHAQMSFPSSEAVLLDQTKAAKTLREGLEDLDASWAALYSKYTTILQETFRDQNVAGFTDKYAPANDTGSYGDNRDRVAIDVGYYPSQGFDLRTLVREATVDVMAQAFALAEFVFTRKISSAMEIGQIGPQNIKGTFVANTAGKLNGATERAFGFNFDQHETGIMAVIPLNSALYRSLSAGMMELMDQMKKMGVWEKTIFHVTQEFGRTPRESAGGSDHGFDSMITSVYTGLRTGGPLVLGNIRRNGSGGAIPANYSGTFGYKSVTSIGSESVVLTPSHVASSLSVLYGQQKNPWANVAQPLLAIEGGNVKAKASSEVTDG